MAWQDLPFKEPLFENLDATALKEAAPTVENMYVNEAGGHTRFPGLKAFADLTPDNVEVYLWEHKKTGDMIAATNKGFVYRLDENGTIEDVTGVALSGGKRAVFAEDEDELLMAAGGPILRLAGNETEILAENLPDSSHVAYISGFVLYVENQSQRFGHSAAGTFRTFDPLDFFSAESNPDFAEAIVVTPFREILVAGKQSIEQYERLVGSATPFFKRWDIGEGIKSPYTLQSVDNANWAINQKAELIRWISQGSRPTSDDIQATLDAIDNWEDAWISSLNIQGRRFIILQMPKASNQYGSKGVTFAYDLSSKAFLHLVGWDGELGEPKVFNVRSFARVWDRNFCGTADGRVLEWDFDNYTWAGETQRMMYRTAHISKHGPANINDCRLRISRGAEQSNIKDPVINLRFIRDQNRPTNWIKRNLGEVGRPNPLIYFGGCGSCDTVQIEYFVTDDAQVEVVAGQIDVMKMDRVG